jgi:DNA adenine methylase
MQYDGGKGGSGVAQWIINQIPPHRVYIAPFWGMDAVFRAKKPASRSIGVDADEQVAIAWQGVPGVTVMHGDALEFLSAYDWQGDEFVYCDPPYLMETRSYQRPLYRVEFADMEQHQALLHLLKTLPCPVAISGYWSRLYASELATWRTSSFNTIKRSGEPATEWLWMNYPQPVALHDYRYLGANFRERERIKKLKARWIRRLRGMPTLQRQALMAALSEVAAPTTRDGDNAGGITGHDDSGHGDDHHIEHTGNYRQ